MFRIFFTIGSLQVIAIFLNFIRSKTIAVMLGPEGVGVISVVDQVVQSASYFCALSLPFAAVKFLSRSHSEGEDAFKRSFSSFLKALLILSALGTMITAGLALFSHGLLGPEVTKYRGLLFIALLGIPAAVLGGYFTNVFAAAQKFKASSLLAIATNAAMLVAVSVGIFFGRIQGLYLGIVIAGIVVTLGTFDYLRRNLGLSLFNRNASIPNELKRSPDIVSFSLIMYVATFTYSLSFLVARYSVLSKFGEMEAGLLQGAIAVAIAMGMVLNPINGLYLTPIMNRSIGKEAKFHTATEFQRKLIVILCVAALPAALFPKLLLAILLSPKFGPASQFVYLFVVWQSIAQLAGVNQALLVGFDDLKVYAFITCLGFAALAVFSWLLVPRLAILGVALAFVISGAVILLLTTARLRFKHGFAFPEKLILLIGYGITVMVFTGLIVGRYQEWDVTALSFKIILYSIFVLSLFFFLSKEEKGALLGFRDRLLLRKYEP
jgi:O-antigen/teichoic acid export membrane protein